MLEPLVALLLELARPRAKKEEIVSSNCPESLHSRRRLLKKHRWLNHLSRTVMWQLVCSKQCRKVKLIHSETRLQLPLPMQFIKVRNKRVPKIRMIKGKLTARSATL